MDKKKSPPARPGKPKKQKRDRPPGPAKLLAMGKTRIQEGMVLIMLSRRFGDLQSYAHHLEECVNELMEPLKDAFQEIVQRPSRGSKSRRGGASKEVPADPQAAASPAYMDALERALKTSSPTAALQLLEEAIDGSRKALGPRLYNKSRSDWRERQEGKAFILALFLQARILYHLGRREAAFEQAQKVLQLQKDNRLGTLSFVVHLLLDLGREEEALALLKGQSAWSDSGVAYARLLLAFRRRGYTTESLHFLQRALELNPNVPAFLLGQSPLPKLFSIEVAPGSPEEAARYALDALPAWKRSGKALQWLRASQREAEDEESASPAKLIPFPEPEGKR